MGHDIALFVTNHCPMPRMETAFPGGVTGAWGHRHLSFLLVALLCFCIRGSTALITLETVPGSPVLGGTVLLTFSFQRQMNIVNWYRGRGNELVQSNVILTYSPSSKGVTNGTKRTGRERLFENGSLEISNLQATDNGYYTVELTPTDGSLLEQDTINLSISGAPDTVNPATQPRPDNLYTTTTTTAQPTGAEGPPRENKSPTGAIVGAIVGVVVAVLLVTAAVLLYKRHQNQRRTTGEHSTDVAQKDLKIHNQRQSTELHQHNGPPKIRLPSPPYNGPPKSQPASSPYETVLPPFPQASPDQEDEHMYMDLDYADRNTYNHLQK